MTLSNLTASQQQLVRQNMKPDDQLPSYFDPTTGLFITISRDFEAYLIITPLATRSYMATWLQQLANNVPTDQAFDNLETEFLQDELRNAQNEMGDYQNVLSDYNQFRSSLNTSGFESIAELGVLMTITTQGLGPISEAADNSQFMFAMENQLTQSHTNTVTTQNTQRALRSWVTVLLSYP